MREVFTAVRISGSGNVVFPDKLIVCDDCIIHRKAKLIGYKETKIMYSAIGSVSLEKHILFADITIETNGGQKIVAHGFSHSDAKKIVNFLND